MRGACRSRFGYRSKLKPEESDRRLSERATHEHDERGYERVTRAQRLIEANTPAERHCKFRPGVDWSASACLLNFLPYLWEREWLRAVMH